MLNKITSHRLFKNASALVIMQLFTYISPFIVLPYLSRALGADGFGLMVAALSLTVLANVCTDFGFNLSATYLISRKQNQAHYISKIVSVIYLLKLFLLVFVFLGISVYLFFSANYTILAIVAIYTMVLFQTFMSPWLFQGIEKMKLITYSIIVSRMGYVVLILLLVKHKDDYDLALMCNAIATMLACFLANWLIKKEGFGYVKPSQRLVKLILLHSSQFFISRVFYTGSSSIGILMLAGHSSSSSVGFYGAGEKLYNAFKSLIYPFSQALYPHMANTGNAKLLLKMILGLSLVMIIPATIGFIYSEFVLELLFGVEFRQGSEILRVFILTGFIGFISVFMGYPAFAALKRVDIANKSVMISGGFLFFMLIFLYFYNDITAVNVAYSVLISECISLSIRVTMFIKLNRKNELYGK
ncbi:oligosaccharide flippase family protein [Morganella morganii]|uniref:oligosaccharide flippase family protein n=1 Tax=Morganella morganii TaxID=582 RepID=UPI001C475763|nr:oligosaccharide flippase family protein [Morganella morganii]QXO58612.1 oligosaccharide flippase family protein [Morganella morganii]QXO77575.1 oligosaccharide flippase family protein [Morganella morganii]